MVLGVSRNRGFRLLGFRGSGKHGALGYVVGQLHYKLHSGMDYKIIQSRMGINSIILGGTTGEYDLA